MITLNEIKKEYPSLNGFDRLVLREYLQYKILDIIFQSKISDKLSFLGGTAIKICYQGTRFSEDLDFDNFDLKKGEFDNLSQEIKSKLSMEGHEVSIKNIFKGAFRCYIKIPKLLFENDLADMEDENIMIQVDTVPHNFSYKPDDFLLNKFGIFRNIRLTPADIILSQKVGALLGRRRPKGRDLYDIVYLMGFADFNFEYLDFKFNIGNKEQLKKKILEKISDFNFKDLTRDALPFLINQTERERILRFKEFIEQKL